MLYHRQFRDLIINPCLGQMSLYSKDAEELLIATLAHESMGGTYLAQVDGDNNINTGAIGIFQIEKETYKDIWNNYLKNKLKLRHRLMAVCGFATFPNAIEMIWNLKFATIMARIFYLRFDEPLPPYNDINKIWEYYKKYWNTENGKAKKDSFLYNYDNYLKMI